MQGGTYGDGTVFRISPSGSYTNLYSFGGYPNDGAYPQAGLVQGSDGNFYGTTYFGGTNSCASGTVFRISPSGSYTNLYSFPATPTMGPIQMPELVQGSDGNFYGTTAFGGTNSYGIIFRLTVAPNPVSLSPPPYPINEITGIQISRYERRLQSGFHSRRDVSIAVYD